LFVVNGFLRNLLEFCYADVRLTVLNLLLFMSCRSIRVVVRTSAEFTREVENGTQHIDGHFTTRPQHVANGHDFDFQQLASELDSAVETLNTRGSGFVLDHVTDFTVVITQYRPLCGSSYMPTPRSIMSKHAVVNVKNNDNRCFQWAILSCLYPTKSNPTNVYSYTKYQNMLNFDGISFPVQVKDIPQVEKLNPQISINVISLDPENEGFSIDYISPERNRQYHVNLLLLHDENTQHYVWIKSFSHLVAGRTKYNGASFVCNSCLNVFSSQRVLDAHIPDCIKHAPQQVVYPGPDDCTLKFRDHDKEHGLHFWLACDFESFLEPSDKNSDHMQKPE